MRWCIVFLHAGLLLSNFALRINTRRTVVSVSHVRQACADIDQPLVDVWAGFLDESDWPADQLANAVVRGACITTVKDLKKAFSDESARTQLTTALSTAASSPNLQVDGVFDYLEFKSNELDQFAEQQNAFEQWFLDQSANSSITASLATRILLHGTKKLACLASSKGAEGCTKELLFQEAQLSWQELGLPNNLKPCIPGSAVRRSNYFFRSCASRCVDIMWDSAHCGRCGNVCSQGASCVEGKCDSGDLRGARIILRDAANPQCRGRHGGEGMCADAEYIPENTPELSTWPPTWHFRKISGSFGPEVLQLEYAQNDFGITWLPKGCDCKAANQSHNHYGLVLPGTSTTLQTGSLECYFDGIPKYAQFIGKRAIKGNFRTSQLSGNPACVGGTQFFAKDFKDLPDGQTLDKQWCFSSCDVVFAGFAGELAEGFAEDEHGNLKNGGSLRVWPKNLHLERPVMKSQKRRKSVLILEPSRQADHNGAFALSPTTCRFYSCWVHRGFNVIIREVSSPMQAQLVMYSLDRKSLDAVIIKGHGSQKALQWGTGEQGLLVAESDPARYFFRALRSALAPDAVVVLDSCSTAEGSTSRNLTLAAGMVRQQEMEKAKQSINIWSYASKRLKGHEVYAPTHPVSPANMAEMTDEATCLPKQAVNAFTSYDKGRPSAHLLGRGALQSCKYLKARDAIASAIEDIKSSVATLCFGRCAAKSDISSSCSKAAAAIEDNFKPDKLELRNTGFVHNLGLCSKGRAKAVCQIILPKLSDVDWEASFRSSAGFDYAT